VAFSDAARLFIRKENVVNGRAGAAPLELGGQLWKRSEEAGDPPETAVRRQLADVETLCGRAPVRPHDAPPEADEPVVLVDPARQRDRGARVPRLELADRPLQRCASFGHAEGIAVDALVGPAPLQHLVPPRRVGLAPGRGVGPHRLLGRHRLLFWDFRKLSG